MEIHVSPDLRRRRERLAIIVSCAPGFANFTRAYVSELQIIKPLRSTFGRDSSGVSGFADKPSKNSEKDPSGPRIDKGVRKQEHREFDVLSDTFESASSNERGEDEGLSYPWCLLWTGHIHIQKLSLPDF